MFEKMFRQSLGRPIEYKGRTIMRYDELQVPNEALVKIRFISQNSEWRQGIIIRVNGALIIDGEKIKNGIVLWYNENQLHYSFSLKSKDNKCLVYNCWEASGIKHSGFAGAAMHYDKIENGKRYYCNDGHLDDNFTDLIFDLAIIKESSHS